MGTFIRSRSQIMKEVMKMSMKIGAGVTVVGGGLISYKFLSIPDTSTVHYTKVTESRMDRYFSQQGIQIEDRFGFFLRSHSFIAPKDELYYGDCFSKMLEPNWEVVNRDTGTSITGSVHVLKNSTKPGVYLSVSTRRVINDGGILYTYYQCNESPSQTRRLDRFFTRCWLLYKRRSLFSTIDPSQ
eukprot:TRINITY_DN1778_c0_g2_i1.p1 TRINITY_DN1778_c0_g2~~TRINITY_DN1778_c0_g2_i1.p1  ORF type:complete len:194 (+),score=10.25 TRINITY_DN1778_c0_g2_i1:29-583(+)